MDLKNIYATSRKLKLFEKKTAELFEQDKIKGASHFSNGNEEQLIKIFRGLRKEDFVYHDEARDYSRDELINKKLIEISHNLSENHPIFKGIQKNDWLFLSYRNHYHSLLKGVSEEWLQNKIVEGWSMTPLNLEKKIISSGIVPGQLPIALGMAKALFLKKASGHVWAFCGDMAAETGIFYECSKYADNHNLPITFVIEDNGLSVDTPTEKVWSRYNNNLRKNTIRYKYKSGIPHQGIGKEVGF